MDPVTAVAREVWWSKSVRERERVMLRFCCIVRPLPWCLCGDCQPMPLLKRQFCAASVDRSLGDSDEEETPKGESA